MENEPVITFLAPWEAELGDKLSEILAYGDAPKSVSHALLPGGVHIYMWPPSTDRPSWLLCTMGLSGHEMPVPRDITNKDEWTRCEVACLVDPKWKGQDESENGFAPMHMLRSVCEDIVRRRLLIKPKDALPIVGVSKYPGAVVEDGPEYNCRVDRERVFVNVYLLLPLDPGLLQQKIANGYDAVGGELEEKYIFQM